MQRRLSWLSKPLKDQIWVDREHAPLPHIAGEEDPRLDLEHLFKVGDGITLEISVVDEEFGGRSSGGWSRGRQAGGTSTQSKSGVQCYNCDQYGHYAGQCPKRASGSGSSGTAQSVNQRSNFAQARGGSRGGRGGQGRNRRGNGRRRTRFSGLNVVYDAEGYEYQVDDDGNIILDCDLDEDAATS